MIASDLADRLGLDKCPRSWRGDCPACSYPRAFSVRSGRNDRPLLYCANGCTPEALNEMTERIVGSAWRPPERSGDPDAEATRARKQAAALRLWKGSAPALGTPADAYLQARGLPGLAASPVLRFRGDCPHPERPGLPALVALVTDLAGEPVAVHRTYLSQDGRMKAAVDPPKASLGPVWGAAIRLADLVRGAPLVVGEGIETAASAGRLIGAPAWAALSAGNLARGLRLPPDVGHVIIACDPDEAGRNAADAAALRWIAEGRRVQVAVPRQGPATSTTC